MQPARLPFLRFKPGVGVIALAVSLAILAPVTAQEEATPDPTLYDPTVCADHHDGSPLSDACAAMIADYPRPPLLTDVPKDRFTISQYSFWKVGPHALPKFDAPNGNIVGEIPEGYNFVTALDLSVDGWMQIQGGTWIQSDSAVYTSPSEFSGVTIEEGGLDHDFAWVLDMSRIHVSEYPGGPWEPKTDRWLKRYERVNIYSTAQDEDGWNWYMIGPNHWVEQRFVSKVSRIDPPEGVNERWVAIDLYEQNLVAYEGDTPVFATLLSSGEKGWDTNEGLFDIWAMLPVDSMSGATGAPQAYALQTVPWTIYYDGGIALHGSYWHDIYGYRTSHGCVNITISDAKWIYKWLDELERDEDGNIPNAIYVYSSGEYGTTQSGI